MRRRKTGRRFVAVTRTDRLVIAVNHASENSRRPRPMRSRVSRTVTAVLSAALLCLGAPLHAQTYPVKPVRYVVAFAAGDSPDIVARLAAERLSKLWNQQMVVENR